MSNNSWSVALTLSWLAPPARDEGGHGWSRRRRDIDAHLSADVPAADVPANEERHASFAEPRHAATEIDGIPGDEIVARIRAGDQDAFAALYMAFRDRLWRFAATLGQSPDVAQELVQELFLSLWTRRASLVVREDIAVYLLTAVRHRVYKVTRHARVVARFRDATVHETPLETSVDVAASDAAMDMDAVRRAIAEALETVTPRERAALMLRWGEGRTYDDIGAVLGVSAMGAHKMVARAMERVRPLLERFRDHVDR